MRNPDQTRLQLLDAAFQEINEHGFRAASLKNILDSTNVTKGALYHHFPSKLEMGYAVLDEIIWSLVYKNWIKPLQDSDNIIDALIEVIDRGIESYDETTIGLGCPLNNLAQEMSPIDEEFRVRINGIFDQWRHAITTGLHQGQDHGLVKQNISAEATAYFIVAAIEGSVCLAKNARSIDVLKTSFNGLKEHLNSMRDIPASIH